MVYKRLSLPLTLVKSITLPKYAHYQDATNKIRSSALDMDTGHSYMHYALSLMRLHSNEHSDHIMPPVDADAYRHIAYTLDAFAYFIRMFV